MKLRIFVIDDEPCIRDTFSWHLTDQGHEVICAEEPLTCNVYQGRQCDHDNPCGDILFIDHQMPRMTGLEFIEKMAQRGCKGLTRCMVLMSGSLSADVIARANALGCRVVAKPLRLHEIDQLVEELQACIPPGRQLATLEMPG